MQVPRLRSEEALVLELLDKDDVLVHPGYFFDFAREAFIVVSLLVDPAVFDRGDRAGAGARWRRPPRDAPPERHQRAAVRDCLVDTAGASASSPTCRMFARWLQEAGQSIVQILPINEMPPIETSPYSAMTAMALDPIYITMADVAGLRRLGAELRARRRRAGGDRSACGSRRASSTPSVRRLKERWLRRAFDRFLELEVSRGSPRAMRFDAFVAAQSWWLDEYALFRSMHAHARRARRGPSGRSRWRAPMRPAAARRARRAALEITYRSYLQWIAAEQWAEAKRLAWPVRVFGDLPFMISADSPDVWARQNEFRFDATIGVPPDAFSETGQDWGLPPWRADVMARMDFAWMRSRARRYGDLYDGYPHRSPRRPLSHVRPADRQDRRRVLRARRRTGADSRWARRWSGSSCAAPSQPSPEVIAEDLGSIPPFVRESMARLDLPGLKVLRWERHWDRDGQPPIDPATFPERSVATTGTHDIEPLAATPEGATEEQRAAIVQSLLSAGSCLTLIPLQDVFGWTDRINTPAVVDEINWTWRLPWPVDRWLNPGEPWRAPTQLKAWTRAAGR